MLLNAERPSVREGVVDAVVDEEIFGEGNELPEVRDALLFAPPGHEKVDREDDGVGGITR